MPNIMDHHSQCLNNSNKQQRLDNVSSAVSGDNPEYLSL